MRRETLVRFDGGSSEQILDFIGGAFPPQGPIPAFYPMGPPPVAKRGDEDTPEHRIADAAGRVA